jgi:hypothetical protein
MLLLRQHLARTRPTGISLPLRQVALGAGDGNGVKRYSPAVSAVTAFSTSSRVNSQRTKFINALAEELGPGTFLSMHRCTV